MSTRNVLSGVGLPARLPLSAAPAAARYAAAVRSVECLRGAVRELDAAGGAPEHMIALLLSGADELGAWIGELFDEIGTACGLPVARPAERSNRMRPPRGAAVRSVVRALDELARRVDAREA